LDVKLRDGRKIWDHNRPPGIIILDRKNKNKRKGCITNFIYLIDVVHITYKNTIFSDLFDLYDRSPTQIIFDPLSKYPP
jgi:hypothetical protein